MASKEGRMVVIEVACLMEGEWSRGMASLMEGEWFCYKGGLFNGEQMVVLERGQFNGDRMIMLQNWPV